MKVSFGLFSSLAHFLPDGTESIRPGRGFKFLFLFFFYLVSSTAFANESETFPAAGLLERLAPTYTNQIIFEQIDAESGKDVFELEGTPAGKVVIRGNNANSMAVGLNHYLKYYCKTSVSWFVDQPVQLPNIAPEVPHKIRKEARVQKRFFLNYCTYGYTMPWWQWRDWERLIDWMALNGVTMPLAITGQESIWHKVWSDFGLTDEEIRSYFTGPAHLPWHRMSNIDRWEGPLPQSWLDHQQVLQKKILARERELGMTPVLPAFSGHVPATLKEKYPESKITKLEHWAEFDDACSSSLLDPMDPLFGKIQEAFLNEQTRQYGTDHIYGVDPLNELNPPSWKPDYLASLSSAIYESLTAADPQAEWLQMGWLFYFARDDWTDERIKALLAAVPQGGLTMLDYFCDNTEVWKFTDSFYGQPYIWCYLGNFGGNTLLAGNMEQAGQRLEKALVDGGKNLEGIGSTLEGLDCNPLVYEYIFEKAWSSTDADLNDWMDQWADRRCGYKDNNVRAAWNILLKTIYSSVPTLADVTLTNMRPMFNGHDTLPYPNTDLFRAWELMLKAENKTRDTYQYDVVNIGRQVLGNHFTTLRNRFTAAYNRKDIDAMESIGLKMHELMIDLDTLLATRSSFLTGHWIEDARVFGIDDAEAAYYEKNARILITTWASEAHPLNDYADRNWAGLTETFYAKRWAMFVDDAIDAVKNNHPFSADDFYKKVTKFEGQWVKQTQKFADQPTGDAVTFANMLIGKYKNEIVGLSIIPKPVNTLVESGSFLINAKTKIVLQPDNAVNRQIAEYLAKRIQAASSLNLEITRANNNPTNAIILEAHSKSAEEEYTLYVDGKQISIQGGSAGLFYGVQTLLQLLPAEIFGQAQQVEWEIPAVKITDKPRFEWRGMHLDVSRHFFPVDFIKDYIDLLAMHKLNVFHWHIVDDQGWRMEIKKYPLLTEKAAWRKGTGTENWDYFIGPAVEGSPKYGGFYTQEEIKDVIQYAQERFITVVPEIEMPGHSRGALDAYPELYCSGQPYEKKPDSKHYLPPFCAGNDQSFQFLENVLLEVLELFPSEYIHIGGDEVPKDAWEDCPKCHKRMQDEGLTDTNELQSYFITRMEKFINSKGRKIIGWDEILEGGLAPNAAVMSWRGNEGGIAAAREKHSVVMSPSSHCYFDYPYERLSLETTYSFEPTPAELNEAQQKYILGAQGNVWTERMFTAQDVQRMALPRMSALAEVVWTPGADRSFFDFSERMNKQYERFDALGVHYFDPRLEVKAGDADAE